MNLQYRLGYHTTVQSLLPPYSTTTDTANPQMQQGVYVQNSMDSTVGAA